MLEILSYNMHSADIIKKNLTIEIAPPLRMGVAVHDAGSTPPGFLVVAYIYVEPVAKDKVMLDCTHKVDVQNRLIIDQPYVCSVNSSHFEIDIFCFPH